MRYVQSKNISDVIEEYLKKILSDNPQIEIRRSEIATLFNCVPSQINYVINTRFTTQQGYLVESKRGGGGYIRIMKVKFVDQQELIDSIIAGIDTHISERNALAIIHQLYDEGIISPKIGNMMWSVLSHSTLNCREKATENKLRATLLVAMLNSLRYKRQ